RRSYRPPLEAFITPRRLLSPNEARSELNGDSPIPELGKATITLDGNEINITLGAAGETLWLLSSGALCMFGFTAFKGFRCRRRQGRAYPALPHRLSPHLGARVAPQRSPILRVGRTKYKAGKY